MNQPADCFCKFLDAPLRRRARLLLLAAVVPLLLSLLLPLWRIGMRAPQYPEGLQLDIYSHRLVGGHGGADLQEINTLNHYIGMRPISRDELRDLDWLPYAFVGLALLALRGAALGNVRTLIDLSVVTAGVTLCAFGRFVYMLYDFGHHLDPQAPVRVQPFMPAVLGEKQVANFLTWSVPQSGSLLLGGFALTLFGTTLASLWQGRREARAAGMQAAARSQAA